MGGPKRPTKTPSGNEFDAACAEVMNNVDGAVACGIVDLDSGLLAGFHALQPAPGLPEAVTSATLELLCGGTIVDGAPPGRRAIAQEAQVLSARGCHFAKVIDGGRAAVMLITARVTNEALGSAQINAAIPRISTRGR